MPMNMPHGLTPQSLNNPQHMMPHIANLQNMDHAELTSFLSTLIDQFGPMMGNLPQQAQQQYA